MRSTRRAAIQKGTIVSIVPFEIANSGAVRTFLRRESRQVDRRIASRRAKCAIPGHRRAGAAIHKATIGPIPVLQIADESLAAATPDLAAARASVVCSSHFVASRDWPRSCEGQRVSNVTVSHEAPLDILRERPGLLLELLRLAGDPVAEESLTTELVDSEVTVPAAHRADLVSILRDGRGATRRVVVVEVQRGSVGPTPQRSEESPTLRRAINSRGERI